MAAKDGEGEILLPTKTAEEQQEDDQHQLELFQLDKLLEIEEKRIDSYNKRTDLGHKIIEAQNDSDKRQFEAHMRKLGIDEESDQRRDSLAAKIFGGFGVFAAIVISFLLLMMFFGDADQIENAKNILGSVAQAAGGGALIYLIIAFTKWLTGKK